MTRRALIKCLVAVIGIPLLVAVAACWWHNTWGVDAVRVYVAMGRECHPVWRDYHFGRVAAGEDVEAVIARTTPSKVVRKGRYTFLSYRDADEPGAIHFTGISATAHDGKMVCAAAWSCTWTRVFFDEMTDEQSAELGMKPRSDPERWGIAKVIR